MKHFISNLSIALILVLLIGCASSPYSNEPVEYIKAKQAFSSKNIEPAAAKLFFRAEKAFREKSYEQAANLYRLTKKRHPGGKAHMLATYRLGTIYYYLGQYKSAVKQFENYLDRYPRSELAFDVTYNLGAAQFQLNDYQKTYELLSELRRTEITLQGNSRAQMVYQLKARAAELIKQHPEAIAAYASQIQLKSKTGEDTKLHSKIDSLLKKTNDKKGLKRVSVTISEPLTRSKVTKRIASLPDEPIAAINMGDVSDSNNVADELSFGNAGLGAGSRAERNHIGVLLPLTGRWSAFGNQALDAILLASRVYAKGRTQPFKLFIEDTGSSQVNAQNAVDVLFNKHQVMAIIGPVNFKEARAVARRCQQLGVANLSLTFKDGISSKGSYLFQNALTPKVQLQSLVRFAIEKKKFQRFAILAPDDSFGNDMTEHFWDLVEEMGGKVVAFQNYKPKETDFQSAIRRMTGLDKSQLKHRQLEVDKIAEFIEEQKEAGIKNPRAKLPPLIDFDALFIPDNSKALLQIAPTLAYLDVNNVPLLGTTQWNNDKVKRAGRSVEGAIFPAGINLATKNPRQKDFIKRYSDAFGSVPELLAAQAYEAMEILGSAIKQTGSSNRNDLVLKLQAMENFETPMGKITFAENRLAMRELPIYSVEYGGKLLEN